MKIGFRTAGFHKRPIAEALQVLGGLGYDGVELCLEHPDCRPEALTEADAARLAEGCAAAGLEVASVSYHADFEGPEQRRRNTVRGLGLVPAFGADVFIINGRRTEPDEAAAWRDLHEALELLLPRARDLGVRIAIEPEPGLAVSDSAEMRRLLDAEPGGALAVNLDVGHAFLTDPDVCESIRMLGSDIAHTHVEGMASGVHQHLLPGEGDLDLIAVCRTLAEIEYRGYCTLDLFNIADNPADWATSALQAMRRIIAQARE